MKRKLISSLLCLCMLFSLIPSAAFAGNEENEGTGATASPAIYSVGYAEKLADARTQIANEMTAAKGGTASTAGSDADDQTMWVIFEKLEKNTNYNVKLTKGGTEIKLSEDSIKAKKNGPGGEPFQTTTGYCAVYWTFKQTADKINGTVMAEGIGVGDYTIQLQKEKATQTQEAEPAATEFEDVAGVKQEFSIGSITIKENKGDSSEQGVTTYYKAGEVTLPAAPTAPAGKAFDGWQKTGSQEKLAAGAKVTVSNTADTYTAQWKDASTEILQAGFSWKAADANKGLMDAIANIGKNGTIRDSIDQTVWLLVQRPAAETDAQDGSNGGKTDLYYWYVVEDSEGATLFEGPVTIGSAYTASSAYFSFLHFGHNEKKVVAPADGKMTVELYSLAENPVNDEKVTKPTNLGNAVATVPIDAGPNPTEITAVTPNVSEETVKVDFNQVMSGRYYIELVKEGTETPVKTYNSDCDWNSNPPGTFETHTFDGVDFTAGKYTVNLYPRAVGSQEAVGKLGTTPIDSKSFTLDGTINSVDVYVGESDTPSTAITAELNEAKTAIEVSGKLVNKENSMTIKLVAHTAAGDVEVDQIAITDASGNLQSTTEKKLTVLGKEYPITLALSAIETPVVETGVSADVSKIDPSDQTTVKASAESVGTTTDLTDMAAVAAAEVDAAKEADSQYVTKAATQLKGAGVTVSSDADVSIVVQPYLDVTAESYDAAKGQLKIDVTAMTRVVATTDDDDIKLEDTTSGANNKNAVVIGTPKKLEVKTPIVITIDLPASFTANANDIIMVQHHDENDVKNGKDIHYHQGKVTVNGGTKTLTFTSSDGLSPFTIDKSAEVTARIGDETTGTYYKTLQDAVNAVENEGIITLLKSDTATVDRTVKFKVDGTDASIVATLKNASGETVNPDENGFYNFTGSGNPSNPSNPTGPSGGGGVSSNVTVSSATNGKVTVTPTAPSKGATVTINLTPDAGYAVGTVTVTDKDGNAVELTKVDDTHYTFVMPDGKVTVKATFTQTETPSSTGFTDVAADAYYADAVKWAVEKGITNGLTATTFGPNNSCTRGQMVTFLWRAAGSPAASGTNSFADVASGEYYYNAVLWAVEKGITNGTSATTFSPNATVNRGQTVTFLYRYAGSPAATGDTSFTDVASSAFYADAVKWAVAEEITNGTSATTFSPASNCTRGQIVTFMYRQMAE